MSPQYKLIYFNLKARAEVIRLLFSVFDQKFEDIRHPLEEWPSIKPTLPFQQAPVLEITENGKTYQIAQSHAIERFLANRFNLLGKTEIERAQVDMIGEEIVDLFTELFTIYRKKDTDEKRKELEETLKENVPNGLKLIQNLLEANKSGYLVGDGITLVDIQLINFYDWLRERKNQVLENFPSLKKHEELVRSHPKLVEHLKKSDKVRLTMIFPN